MRASAGEEAHRGATWTFAEGKRRAKGPTNSLCSTAKVGSTMCSTGQPSSFTRAMHSLRCTVPVSKPPHLPTLHHLQRPVAKVRITSDLQRSAYQRVSQSGASIR